MRAAFAHDTAAAGVWGSARGPSRGEDKEVIQAGVWHTHGGCVVDLGHPALGVETSSAAPTSQAVRRCILFIVVPI